MVCNFLTILHRFLREYRQDFHQKLESHFLKILRHSTTHLLQYQTYQMTLIPIQIQNSQILIHQTHLIFRTPWMLQAKKGHVRNIGLRSIWPTLLNSAPSLNPNYLKLRTIHRLRSLNWIRILYGAGIISLSLLIHSKLCYHYLCRLACCLWNIHP